MNLRRIRLHLLTLQILGPLFLTVCIAVSFYALLRREYFFRLERQAQTIAQAVTFSVEREPGQQISFDESVYLTARPGALQLGSDTVVFWSDNGGKVLSRRGGLDLRTELPLKPGVTYQKYPVPACIYTLPALDEARQPLGFATVGLSLEPLQQELQQLLSVLLCAGLVTVAITLGVGWWWTGRILSPIEEAHVHLSLFAGAVAHELRSPLTAMRTQCQSMVRHHANLSKEDLVQAFRDLDQSSAGMATLVHDLLLLARSDQSPQSLCRPIQLSHFLGQFAVDFSRLTDEKQVGLRILRCDGDVWANPSSLRIILRNLIENALRYSEPGSQVDLSSSSSGKLVEITVTDRGVGMTRVEVDHMFDPFWRAEPSRARHRGGSGLGLAIVQRLVAAQGGSIQVDSAPQIGTTIRLYFPIPLPQLS